MEFDYSYYGNSGVTGGASDTRMSFAPDATREPTYFQGELAHGIGFREAISALHDVVISDLRFKPKDREAYKAWLATQEDIDWAEVAGRRRSAADRMVAVQRELTQLNQRRSTRWNTYYRAQRRYFDWLYQHDKDAWWVLDPVITVHPDEIFFECFSQDESSYGRLGVGYEQFSEVNEFACGTTNIDYSEGLYNEFQKIRSYKKTRFEVDPTGFGVRTTHQDDFREVKIDLPDSWVRGFLQVSSAMSLPAARFTLHPMDIYNLCFALRRNREKKGPRSIRWKLTPGAPVTAVLDPWGWEIPCPRSMYTGHEAREIRTWGRRRLHILERLIPVARGFTVHLLGSGLPSFYVADLGDMSFTLGLSGWTANDWSASGNFDLMAPRAEVDDTTKRRVFDALRERWFETPDSLSSRTGLSRSTVLGALGAWTQAGRAIYDLNKNVYRVRELSRDPLPMDRLRFANEREENARRYLDLRTVNLFSSRRDAGQNLHLTGSVRAGGNRFNPTLTIDRDERIVRAECTCRWYRQNKLHKGPCEHMLALRMQHAQQV